MKRLALILSLVILAGCTAGKPSQPPTPEQITAPAPTPQQGTTITFLQMTDAVTGWAAAGGRLYRTSDGWRTWTDVTPLDVTIPAVPDGLYRDGNTAWVAAPAGDNRYLRIYRTTDGGRIWETATIEAIGQAAFSFRDEQNGWLLVKHGAAMGSMPVSLFGTKDGGRTWTKRSESEGPKNPAPAAGALPFGGVKTGVTDWHTGGWVTLESREPGKVPLWATRDDGLTWTPQELPVPENLRQHSLTADPPRFVAYKLAVLPVTFVPGYETIFYTSTDGGGTWKAGAPVKTLPHLTDAVSGFLDGGHGWTTDGTQIYTTADGGRSWQSVTSAAELKGLKQLQFTAPDEGWAVADAGLLKTTDGGRTWTAVPVPAGSAAPATGPDPGAAANASLAFVQALLAHDVPAMQGLVRPDRQALASSPEADVRSGHGGAADALGGPYIDWDRSARNEEWALVEVHVGFVYGGEIARQTIRLRLRPDSTGRWLVEDFSIPTLNRAWQYGEEPHFTALYMTSADGGWAQAAMGRLLRTSDGGHTWTDVTPPDPALGRPNVAPQGSYISPDVAWTVVANRDGDGGRPVVTAYLTRDGGQSWAGGRLPLDGGPIYRATISAVDDRHAWVMVEPEHGMSSYPGDLYATADGGQTWRIIARTGQGAPGVLPFGGRVRFVNETTGWLAGNRAGTMGDLLAVTLDGGLTWAPVDLGLKTLEEARQPRVVLPSFSPSGQEGVLGVTLHGEAPGETLFYITADGGRTWRRSGTRLSWTVPVFLDGRYGWVQDEGRPSITTDGGFIWHQIAKGGQPELEQVTFSPDRSQGWGLDKTGLWRTDDGGQTWARVDSRVRPER